MTEVAKARAGLAAALMGLARNLAAGIHDEDAGLFRAVGLLDTAGPLVARLAGSENLAAAMELVNEAMQVWAGGDERD